jgi:hypothetical protein
LRIVAHQKEDSHRGVLGISYGGWDALAASGLGESADTDSGKGRDTLGGLGEGQGGVVQRHGIEVEMAADPAIVVDLG